MHALIGKSFYTSAHDLVFGYTRPIFGSTRPEQLTNFDKLERCDDRDDERLK